MPGNKLPPLCQRLSWKRYWYHKTQNQSKIKLWDYYFPLFFYSLFIPFTWSKHTFSSSISPLERAKRVKRTPSSRDGTRVCQHLSWKRYWYHKTQNQSKIKLWDTSSYRIWELPHYFFFILFYFILFYFIFILSYSATSFVILSETNIMLKL